MARVHNFGSGPSALPIEVLETARAEFLDYGGSGMSILESSHRSKLYDEIHHDVMDSIRELLGLGDRFEVLLLGGGASLQFALLPLNLLRAGRSADYVLTGHWSEAALREASLVGTARVAATTAVDGLFTRIPDASELRLDPAAAYCHVTSNNTIEGTQWRQFPDTGGVPLAADMSSDLLSRPFDPSPFGIIYAGAQKNLGPAGLTVVLVRRDVLELCRDDLPAILRYRTHAAKQSLYNTPPVFAIYIARLTLRWLRGRGGLAAVERENEAKGARLYRAIDASGGFYRSPVPADSRSLMNVVFRLADEALEARFLEAGAKAGLVGMKGHRVVGGLRVSIYNATRLDAVNTLIDFMTEFERLHG